MWVFFLIMLLFAIDLWFDGRQRKLKERELEKQKNRFTPRH